MANHTAGPQFAGYLYQAEQALLIALTLDSDSTIRLEGLDDIEISSGNKKSLIQAKHHVDLDSKLSDSSAELWKSLRVWADYMAVPTNSIADVSLFLMTVATVVSDSAASLLQSSKRDEKKAGEILAEIAKKSPNKALKESYLAFSNLTAIQREQLLSAITVLDGAIQITACERQLKKRLEYSARPEHLQALYERLKGWWYEKVIEQITEKAPKAIDVDTIKNKIFAIQDTLKPGALPIDYLEAHPPEDYLWKDKIYVEQLRAIDIKDRRISSAVLDYYRAYQQRSRWVRDTLLIDGDILSYERLLVEEIQRRRDFLEDEYSAELTPQEQKDVGKRLLNWMEWEAEIPIRPSISEGYVMRGSFHMLADNNPPIRTQPVIFWHSGFAGQPTSAPIAEEEGKP
jgi:hypothetical protein